MGARAQSSPVAPNTHRCRGLSGHAASPGTGRASPECPGDPRGAAPQGQYPQGARRTHPARCISHQQVLVGARINHQLIPAGTASGMASGTASLLSALGFAPCWEPLPTPPATGMWARSRGPMALLSPGTARNDTRGQDRQSPWPWLHPTASTGRQLPRRALSRAERAAERSRPAELPARMKAAPCHPPTAQTAPAGPPGYCGSVLQMGMEP